MSDPKPLAAIIVVNYGSHQLLAGQLAPQLARRPLPGVTGSAAFVIVDNFSSDVERTAVEELCEKNGWTAVLRDQNDGFGAGMNAGVAHAEALGADTVVLVNPDAVISVHALALLVQAARREPDTIWAPSINRSDGHLAFAGGSLDLHRGTLSGRGLPPRADEGRSGRHLPWLSGACLALSVALWRRLGGFDDDYFMYWEDVDLTVRAHLMGAELRMLETAAIVHDPGGTQATSSTTRRARLVKSPLYVRYNCRNRLVFASKLVDPSLQRSWLLGAPAFAREVTLRSGRRELIRRPALLVAALRGTAEGLNYWLRHRHRTST